MGILRTLSVPSKKILWFWAVVPLAIVAACGSTLPDPQGITQLHNVPFFKQDDFQCGPAALATVINYWYQRKESSQFLTTERIVSDIYSSSARGVLGVDLELYARRLGFDTRQYSGSFDDIKKKIDQSIPLILLVDYGFSVYQVNHFMVVIGYATKGVIVHSGRERNEYIPNDKLRAIWQKTGFWTLAIRPLPLS